MSFLNNIVNEFDIALKTLSNKKSGTGRTYPPEPAEKNSEEMTTEEKKCSIQMMRVNLAGEVAAQALYRGQSLVCKDPEIREHLIEAGDEETDHLVWCKKRLDELNGSGSVLNPIWYAGSFAIGAIFGRFGEKVSLGFVEETEKQVVAHIDRHLDKISPKDKETIEILRTMKEDDFIGKEELVKRKASPQKKLVGLELIGHEPAVHGDCVHEGRAQIGVITSGMLSPKLGKNIALCRIDVKYSEIGTEVEVGKLDGHQKRIGAKVVAFPFYDPTKSKVRA